MPVNQTTTYPPTRPVWVIGLEYLELSLLNWFVTTHMIPQMTRAVAEAEVGRGLTRERIEELLATGQMLFRRNTTPKLQQYYTFFTKNMVKAVRNHSDKIMFADSSMFSGLTNLEFEAHAFDGADYFYRAAQHRQCVYITFQTAYNPAHGFAQESERYEYYVVERNNTGYILGSSRFPSPPNRNVHGLGPSVSYTDSWISNPHSVRLPEHVINSLSYQNRTSESYAIVSPINNRFVDKASYILDWLSSDSAPKNLNKLNYFDALRKAGEWHEERTRRRNAAMRSPVRPGVTVTEVDVSRRVLDLSNRTDMDIFMAGRIAGRTNTFRAMFDLERGQMVYPTKKETQVTEVTEADYTLIWERDGWRVFALESQAAFVKESELMSHCIGESPRYWRMKEEDPHHYIAMTLRSPAEQGFGKATATFDYYPARGFTQLKGYDNRSLTIGASDMFVRFLDDIARFGVEYTSPLFTKNEDEYANSTPFPMIYAAKWFDYGNLATAFHGDARVVKNYLDRNVHIPSAIDTLLNPITKSNIEQMRKEYINGEEVQIRFLEEPRGGLTWVGVDEVAPLHQIQALDRLLRAREGSRVGNPEYGVPIQDLIAQDPNPCNEVEIPVSPSVVTVETGQATTIHLPEVPEGTTFRIYRNRGN